MTNFGTYAQYYDWFYQDKPYAGEVDFLLRLAALHGCEPDSILELGIGTGGHAVLLADRLQRVVGVDMSSEMLAIARSRRAQLSPTKATRVALYEGDIRTFRIGERFPLVASLFHVISYQCTDDDVRAAFKTARHHLGESGLFIFDFWHGPGVVSDPPRVRSRTVTRGDTSVVRTATPKTKAEGNVVDVSYDFDVKDLKTERSQHFSELHRMRYFFEPELKAMLADASLEFVASYRWESEEPPKENDWSAAFVARAT